MWVGKRILILDQECLALYSKPYEVGILASQLAFFVMVRVVASVVVIVIIIVVVVVVAILLLLPFLIF